MNGTGGVLAGLRASCHATPDAMAICAIDREGRSTSLTYRELYDKALRAAAGLALFGVKRGERVVLAMPTCADFFCVYLGCLLAGTIPAVVAPPREPGGTAGDVGLGSTIQVLGACCAVVTDLAAWTLKAVPGVAARTLVESPPCKEPDACDADDIAHLQRTSGTTAMPRWAIVRHRNIAANARAIGLAVGHRREDVLVTWLPMSHDMGLIGVSYAWYWGITLVAADPGNFIRTPLSWLELIARYGGTLSPAPNSAFQACVRLAKLRPPKGLDLSRWRVALCGSEPVHEATLREFLLAFGRFGLRHEALRPVYGLAEATLAATVSPAVQPFRAERVDPASCAPGATVVPSGERRGGAVAVVGCGKVIPGHELRVVDAAGYAVGEGVVGEIEFRGESVIDGYFAAEGDVGLKRDGFLRTGDLGYLRNGELFVTGRSKEILIINGRNFSPLQIEGMLERALAAPFTPAVVAVEAPDEQLRSGALHVLLDSRLGPPCVVDTQVREVLDAVFGLRGVTLHRIVGGQIPRTTSGKIRRIACRELIAHAGKASVAAQIPARQSVSG